MSVDRSLPAWGERARSTCRAMLYVLAAFIFVNGVVRLVDTIFDSSVAEWIGESINGLLGSVIQWAFFTSAAVWLLSALGWLVSEMIAGFREPKERGPRPSNR